MYIIVYLHVNITLLKVKTENKYNLSLLSHANSFSISSVSTSHNFIIQLFPTTILWVHVVKLSTEHVSNIALATPKWSKLKWIFQSKENTKLCTESHDMVETTWMSESSILLLLETEFLTLKLCNTLWKKSMHEHMWLTFVVSTCNYLYDFFLTIWLWKPFTYMLFIWGFIFQAP